MIAAFHKREKIKPVSDSAVCYRTFQSPTNRDVPRTEKRVTHKPNRQCTDKRLAYHNSATRLQCTEEGEGSLEKSRAHRITTCLPLSVQALLQPSLTFYTVFSFCAGLDR